MAKKSKGEGAYVALLRGINVGGKRSLPMKALAAMFEDAGCRNVRTYIQSGNVVYGATGARAEKMPVVIAEAIAKRFEMDVPVVTRSAAELREVVRGNPFLRAGVDPGELHVAFLADRPARDRIAALDPKRSPPDELVLEGRDIFLRCPNGIGRSKLTNDWFDRTLATTSTIRNWRTVLALLEMAEAS